VDVPRVWRSVGEGARETAGDAVDEGIVFALGVEDFGKGVVGGELDALKC